MEVNDYWNDRGAPERVDQINIETKVLADGATGIEGSRILNAEAREWEQLFAGQRHHRPLLARMSSPE